jgi:hypothetical protein
MYVPRTQWWHMRNHVGFTGTQRGMSRTQLVALAILLNRLHVDGCTHFHQGDCIGGDAEAHAIANEIGYVIEVHPPTNDSKRAHTERLATKHPIILHEPKPYLVRNHEIVDACSYMVAAPFEMTEQLRSGTWATVRYARKERHCTLYMLEREVKDA